MILPAIPCKFKGVEYMFIPNSAAFDKGIPSVSREGGLLCTMEELLRFETNQPKMGIEAYYAVLSASGQIRRKGEVIGNKSDLVFVDEKEVLELMSAGVQNEGSRPLV